MELIEWTNLDGKSIAVNRNRIAYAEATTKGETKIVFSDNSHVRIRAEFDDLVKELLSFTVGTGSSHG